MKSFIHKIADDLVSLSFFVQINNIDESLYAEHIQNIHLILEDMKTKINEVKK